VTRLTGADVTDPGDRLARLDRQLHEIAGLGLRELALEAAGGAPGVVPFAGRRVAAVPVTTGLGLIGGFSTMVAAVLDSIGCDAVVTGRTDVAGIHEAVLGGARALFLADDTTFIALDVESGRCADNDTATAAGYVAALAAAADGLAGRPVFLLGLGPVGRAAARFLLARGALVLVAEPDRRRREAALAALPTLRPVSLAEGLAAGDLIFDATPAPGIIGAGDIRVSTIAAVPGIPSGFTAEAQAALGSRHIHDPLAIGVATMAAMALR